MDQTIPPEPTIPTIVHGLAMGQNNLQPPEQRSPNKQS